MAEKTVEPRVPTNGTGPALTTPPLNGPTPVPMPGKPCNHLGLGVVTNSTAERSNAVGVPAPLNTALAKTLGSTSGPGTPVTPQPTTPLTGPIQGANLSPVPPNSPAHDLPMELLQAGWRKFWSRRENRHYFFNKFNNESRWEMPMVGVGSVSQS